MKKINILSIVLLLAGLAQNTFAAITDASAAADDTVASRGYGTWKPLSPGDTVYIIAPANGVNATERDMAKANVERSGLIATWNDAAFTDETKDALTPERAMAPKTAFEDLIGALNNPDVKAIWAIRGGRLSCELWDHLDGMSPGAIAALPKKPILGFSDVTSLHLWFNGKGFPTIHTLVALFGKESPKHPVNKLTSFEPTLDLLMGRASVVTYTGFEAINDSAKALAEVISGPLMGGNLSSLHYYQSAYETPAPSIWMIETTDDATRIESILLALRKGDFFKKARAIVFGNLHGQSADDDKFALAQARYPLIVQKFAAAMGVPVFSTSSKPDTTFDFGHGDWNLPFSLGTLAELVPGTDSASTTLSIAAS